MSLVEEYFELNEVEKVSVVWKVLQIGLYGLAAGLGLWCGFTLAKLRLKFDDKCYLFTEAKASTKDGVADQSNINWENDAWCDYYQFSLVSSFIVGIMWGTLFLMCGKGGKSFSGLSQPWRIVWPSLVFNLIYFIITLNTAIGIQRGTNYFCGRTNLYMKIQSKSLLENCEVLKTILKNDWHSTALQLELVTKTSWGCASSWFVVFLLSLLRIVFVVDFQMYKICVFQLDNTQNKKEEVLKITNYEELMKLYFDKDDEVRVFETERTGQDVEAGGGKKTKVDKKSMRQHFNIANKSPLETNSVFYETADLRTLNRDNRKNKTFKALDEAFGKNKTNLGVGLRKSLKAHYGSDDSSSNYFPNFSYQNSTESNRDENDGDNSSSFTSTTRKSDRTEHWNEPGSRNETLVCDIRSNRLLKHKKRI